MTSKGLFLFLATTALSGVAFGQADECFLATDLGTGATSAMFNTNVCVDTGTRATRSSQQQCSPLGNDIWFEYTASLSGIATFDTCNNADFDTKIAIWEGGDCSTMVGLGCNDLSPGCFGSTSRLTVPVTAGQTYRVQIGYPSNTANIWGTGTLTIAEAVLPDCSTPDALEVNTNCANARPVVPGSYPDLNAEESDNDYYSIEVPPGEKLTVDIFFTDSFTDLDLYLWDPAVACDTNVVGIGPSTGALALGFTASDNESFSYGNATNLQQSLIIEVDVWTIGGCNEYDMVIDISPDDCSVLDPFEPNMDCATATPLSDATYTGLAVQSTNNDYYLVDVAPGATLSADVLFNHAGGDIDLYLWDPLVACDTNVAGPGDSSGALAVGFSVDDDESIAYTNLTGGRQSLVVEVDMYSPGGCNLYDLVISGSSGSGGGIGTPYCTATPNSTGAPAAISASGSSLAVNNDVELRTTGVPSATFAFYLVSLTQDFIVNPAGSQGNLCLGGQIGRYVGPGQIQNSGQTRSVSLQVNLNLVPSPVGFVAVVPGDTWNFTTWFRDTDGTGTATSNFSNGLSITFL